MGRNVRCLLCQPGAGTASLVTARALSYSESTRTMSTASTCQIPAGFDGLLFACDHLGRVGSWRVAIIGTFPTSPGSRGTLPCPSPLRTARESFPSSRSSLSNALYRDAASPPKVPGYGLAYGNLDEVARGSPADLPLRLLDVRYGDCSIP